MTPTCASRYDSAGEFAYRVGLPAKSGVGGGILAVIPDRGVACVWSPALGPSGSSAAGLAALDAFTTYSDWTASELIPEAASRGARGKTYVPKSRGSRLHFPMTAAHAICGRSGHSNLAPGRVYLPG